MKTIILGLGCDRNTSQKTIETAVAQALEKVDLNTENVLSLATIDKKKDEPGLLAVSRQHGWPLEFFSAEQLRKIPVPNPSDVVMKYMGTPAVAEAAAVLAARTDINSLILEKHKYRGDDGKNATVSIVALTQ